MHIRSKGYLRDSRVLAMLLGGGACLIGSCVEIALANRPAAEVVFLHYSVVAGVSVTGVWSELYLIPVVAAVLWVGNIVWSRRVHTEERALAYLVLLVGCGLLAGMWWGIHLLLVFNG